MLVKIEKNGQLLEVHPDAVADHLRLGWQKLSEKAPTREDILELAAKVDEQEARIQQLEGDLDLVTGDDPEADAAMVRIAELEAKLAAGTITRGEKGVLTKLKTPAKAK